MNICTKIPLFLSCVVALLTGCSGIPIPGKHGTHYLIVGLGLVHCPTNSVDAVSVSRMHGIGMMVQSDPVARFSIGYASGTAVSVPPNADDVRVEVSLRPGGPLEVACASAILQTNNTNSVKP